MKDLKGNELINYTFAYDYDHDWRLMQNSLIMNDNETVLSRHSYTETGMLRDKLLHPQGSQALYRLRHDYNVRGWLTGINNPADGHPDRYFGMRLYYESPPQHALPHAKGQFNGNISAMQWFTKEAEASTNTNGFAYVYDGLNRLTNAVFYRFKDGSVSYVLPEHASNKRHNYGLVTGIGSVNDIRYDKNGNILGLKRLARQHDEVMLFDDFSYTYNGNRLIALDDAVQGQNDLGDFHDNDLYYNKHNMDEYRYDANGNMIADMNRNMKLAYGIFHNMPIFISFEQVGGGGGGGLVEEKPIDASGKTATTTSYSGDIVNHYTYQGRKLGKKVYNSQHTLTVDEEYYDELMFSFGKPSRISHGDGYIALSDNGGATFYYYLKDHLGNVRSVILPDANNEPIVSQANDYFPFGMSFESTLPNPGIRANYNKLKYNSKEEQEMPGKWLDYGARFYDAQIGRFTTLDRFAVDFSSWSPYHYANNNPILNIDINGDSTFVAVNDNGTYTVTGGNLYNKEDKGLYSMNVDGTYTQVGETLTTHSFFDDNGNAVVGAVIDPNSNEGTEFIIELAMDNPELTEYMVNATNGEKYDFKEKGIDERPEGTTIDQHRYRGSAASDGVYGSARDFGNIGAGMVAGRKGLSWKQARLGFDTYQSYKSKKITSEGQTTQKAQKVGFSIGIQLRKKEK